MNIEIERNRVIQADQEERTRLSYVAVGDLKPAVSPACDELARALGVNKSVLIELVAKAAQEAAAKELAMVEGRISWLKSASEDEIRVFIEEGGGDDING